MEDIEIENHFLPFLTEFAEDFRWLIKNKPLLAHYTSMSVLENILKNREIWFSNPLYMNDLEEMRFGMLEGRKVFYKNDAITNLCGSPERYDIITNTFEQYFSQFDVLHAFDVYIFCLTEHEAADTDGVLSMWRGYGGQGSGAAIVFNTNFMSENTGYPLFITKVVYDTRENRMAWLDRKISQFCEPLIKQGIKTEQIHIVARNLFNLIKLTALKSKHIGFVEEREWRIIYLPDVDRAGILKDQFGYAIGSRGVEPKLKFRIEPNPNSKNATWSISTIVERIILGPSSSSPLALNAVRRMLEIIERHEFRDRLHASGIPLRPS